MAETVASPNNQLVAFRDRRRKTMPVVSKAQNAAMYAAKNGNSTLGIPASVGAEMVADQEPGDVKKLPERARKAKKMFKRGRISSTAAKKHLGTDYGNENNIDASSR